MCQKSDGGYYRALKTGDIQEILSRINAAISKPKPEPVMEIVKAAEKEKAFPMEILLIVAIGGIVAISMIAAKTLVFRSIASREESIPEAYLLDVNGITDEDTHKIDKQIDKRFFTIGRSKADGIDMSIDKDTVSALQAQIEYRDHSFYLTDMNSKNGTFLNNRRDRVTDEVRLKSGDVIIFDQYRFKFLVPGLDEWGATKLSQLTGETVLNAPKTPEQPSPEEKKAEPKPLMCPEHPSYEATDMCPVCRRILCIHCMVEKDGKRICRRCLDIYFTPNTTTVLELVSPLSYNKDHVHNTEASGGLYDTRRIGYVV